MAERWSGLRVLVVDDDPDHRFLMSKRLQAVGMRPDTTGDPGEVMEKLASSDIVLLDYKIPGTSGIDLLGQIFRANGPPVVMVTGMGSEAVAVEALQAGAVDYVIKTSTYLDELPTVVEEAWRKHDVDRRADALQTIAMLVTSATDSEEVVKGITTGARRLLAADRVEMVFDEASRARRKRLPSSPVLQLDVPIVASTGERIGTIAVHTKEPRTYSTDDCELVETFASFAAIGLANARTIQEERDAVGELKDTLDMRRQLVAAVGHELRTPLTSIAGFSSTLLRHLDSFCDEERRQMIERIDRNSHDLTD
ncbi:MAG: response regulator, partial [Acidimicrobiales bacterium]